jgi:hypothetical protein
MPVILFTCSPRLQRMEGSGIIVPRTNNSAQLHRPWRAIRVFYDVSGTTVEILAIVAKSEAESWLAEFANPE